MSENAQRFLDKTYLLANNGLLFNVTGYRHPSQHVYCGLKYVNGEKWTRGYEAAKTLLKREHPEFVDEYIRVPKSAIQHVYHPATRWQQLLATPRAKLPALLIETLELGHRLSQALSIPIDEFGVTDSLLWGDGHAASDIDLVVFGNANAKRVLEFGNRIYADSGFQRPDPDIMTAPYSLDVPGWPELLSRKYHMGSYLGRLFSLRAIKNVDELDAEPRELPIHFERDSLPTSMRQAVTFKISDASHSLYFPAVYHNEAGDELVDYSVVYEGVFRCGETVHCECDVEKVERSSASSTPSIITRYTIVGDCQLPSPRVCAEK